MMSDFRLPKLNPMTLTSKKKMIKNDDNITTNNYIKEDIS